MSQSETSKLMGIVTGEQNHEKRGITIAFTSLIVIQYLFIIALLMTALVMQGFLKPALIVGFVIIHVVVLVTRALFHRLSEFKTFAKDNNRTNNALRIWNTPLDRFKTCFN